MNQSAEKTVITLMRPGTRIVYGLIGLIVIAAVAVSAPEYGISAPGLAIAAACLLALCYEERWTFDYRRETAIFRHGLLFFAKRRAMAFADIGAVRIDRFEKGFAKTGWVRVSLELLSGEKLIIESAAEKKSAALISTAESLGAFFQSYRKQAT